MTEARQRIEEAAVEEFAAFGFHGARVWRIADGAGVNKQLIYHYFGSKRQLHEHAMGLAARHIAAGAGRGRAAGSPASPGERLRALLHVTARRLREEPNLVRAALLGTLGSTAPEGAFSHAAGEIGRRVAIEVSRGQGLGFFRDDADPDECGQHAAVLLLGWVALEGVMGEMTSAEGDSVWIDSVIALISRSLTW